MAKGASKLAGGKVVKMSGDNTLKALQTKAKGTPAEEWYNNSGQSYEQLRAMENIYDLRGTTKNVRSFASIESDSTLSTAKDVLDSAPNGTVVSYQTGEKTTTVMKKSALGQWTSYEIFSPSDSTSVVMGGSYKKYTPVQAVNTFTTLQAGALRKTLNKNQLKAFKGYL